MASEDGDAPFVKHLLGVPAAESQRTVSLGLSLTPGVTLQGTLWFKSETWVNAARSDIGKLFDAYDKASRSKGSTMSPFELMKHAWKDNGWTFVHLLAVADGPNKFYWADSVCNLFMERFKSERSDESKAAVVFALYLFWATQPTNAQQIYIKIDPATLDDISSLPDKLGETTTTSAVMLQDVRAIVYQLLSQSAFFIVPSEAFLHPELPLVSVERQADDQTARQTNELRKIERSIDNLRKRGRTSDNDPLAGQGRQDVRLGGDSDDAALASWVGDLRTRQAQYLAARDQASPWTPEHTNRTAGGLVGHDDQEEAATKSIFERAQAVTAKALQAAQTAAHDDVETEGGRPSAAAAAFANAFDAAAAAADVHAQEPLIGLVQPEAQGQGLREFENVIQELQTRSLS